MNIITVDGKEWNVKYKQNAESLSFSTGTVALDYPDFIGSKLYQNSSSSDKFTMTFSIHLTLLVGFKESMKKFVTNEDDAAEHQTYGKLTHIIIEHELFGAIKGAIIGDMACGTSSGGDISCSFTFQEHTEDNPVEKRDVEIENEDANDGIDTETTGNFDVNLSVPDLNVIGNFANALAGIYSSIQNSAIVSAFNDFNSAITSAIIDSKRVMNSIKNIISLPNQLVSQNLNNKLNLFKQQAEAVKNVPVSSYNIALFNMNSFSYNVGATSRTAFVSEAATQAAAGIKTVPL